MQEERGKPSGKSKLPLSKSFLTTTPLRIPPIDGIALAINIATCS